MEGSASINRKLLLLASLATVLYLALRKSPQKVKVVVSSRSNKLVRSGLKKISPEAYYVPYLFKHSYAQLLLFMLQSHIQNEIEPSFRESVMVSDSGDHVLLDWFLPANYNDTTPIVVYIPGITGTLREAFGFTKEIIAKGWVGVVFHRRGHEANLRCPSFNIFGNARDLRIAIECIHASSSKSPIFLVGSSAGSAVMVRYLGEFKDKPIVQAAVGLSPGYDIENMWNRIHGSFFDRYLAKQLKKFFIQSNETILSSRNRATVERLYAAQTVEEFAKLACNFASETSELNYEEWLKITCPLRVAHNISTPCLCLNALDDPICHRDMVMQIGYSLPHENLNCALIITENGSHCSHQYWSEDLQIKNWGHHVALQFFDGILEHLQEGQEDENEQ